VRHCVIFIHGIQVREEDYALALARALRLGPLSWGAIQWAHVVQRDLLDYEKLYPEEPAPFWRPLLRLQQKAIRIMHRCDQWVQAYMEPDNREKAIGLVRAEIKRLQEDLGGHVDKISFVAHSQGTVLAAQAIEQLVLDRVLLPDQVGAICTLGSPLFRLKPVSVTKRMLARIPADAWINLFDSNDPIAGRLQPISAAIEDIEVETGRTMLGAHTRYWKSREVAGHIKTTLERLESQWRR